MKNSWLKITDKCVTIALQSGYIDRKWSIARHEKFESKVLHEIES